MRPGWLWDKNISMEEIQKILKDPDNPRFIIMAEALLSRNNVPKEVFAAYLDRRTFVENWTRIKRQMRKDSWNNPRIIFWQFVYERVLEKFRQDGIKIFERKSKSPVNEFCRHVGGQLKRVRKKMHLTQDQLAQKIGISQQMISRIESGQENMSLTTLHTVTSGLGGELSIRVLPK
jgi:DNA-binding XRE family transcriptional regulator